MTAAWQLLQVSDAARAIALWCIAGGVLCGAAMVVCFAGWRRLTRPEDTHLLRIQLADANARVKVLAADLRRVLGKLSARGRA